jgi:hypothetical protein
MPRAHLLTVMIAIGVLGGGTATALDRYLEARRDDSLADAYVVAIAADLHRDRDALEAALTTLDEQLRYADFLLDYAEVGGGSSSAIRMDALGQLMELPASGITTTTFEDVRFTDRGHLLQPPRLRESLIAYYDLASIADFAGDALVREYVVWLDRSLDRGSWLHVRGEEVGGRYPLDFKATTEELRSRGLAEAVRSARRGLETRRAILVELLDARAALASSIESFEKE